MHDNSPAVEDPVMSRDVKPTVYPLPVGRQCIMEFHQCVSEILSDPKAMEEVLHSGLRTGNLTLVKMMIHAFAPHGLTLVAVLEESHLVMHTWPEFAFVAADLFTCGEEGDPQGVCATFIEELKPRQYNVRCFEREAMVTAGPDAGEGRR